mgnify:CR=1 FL=1
MEKQVPEPLKPHILPFNWDVNAVWSIAAPAGKVERSTLDYLLHLPLWSSVPNRGMLFDISPIEVLEDPNCSPYQIERIEKADETIPIDLLEWNGKRWILDGVHRLAKLYREATEQVEVRIHPASAINKIKCANN